MKKYFNAMTVIMMLTTITNLNAEQLIYKGIVENIKKQNQFRFINGVLSTTKIYGDYRSLALNEDLIPNVDSVIEDINVGDNVNATWDTSKMSLYMTILKSNSKEVEISLIDGKVTKTIK